MPKRCATPVSIDPSINPADAFNESTIRLVADLLQSYNQPSWISSNSFRKLLNHLNPTAIVPTVHDVLTYTKSAPFILNESRCIACCEHHPDHEMVALDMDSMAMILTTLIIGTQKTQNEAKELMASESSRACKYHLPIVSLAIMTFLEMRETLDFSRSQVPKLAEACMYFKSCREIRMGIVDTLMIPQFKEKVIKFLELHYDPNVVVNPRIFQRRQYPEGFSARDSSSERSEPSPGPSTSSIPTQNVITLPNGKKIIKMPAVPLEMKGATRLVKYRVSKRVPPATEQSVSDSGNDLATSSTEVKEEEMVLDPPMEPILQEIKKEIEEEERVEKEKKKKEILKEVKMEEPDNEAYDF